MDSRNVSSELETKSTVGVTRILEREIIPLFRRQKGFDDEISFIASERNEVVAIRLWDKKDDLEAYIQRTYPDVLKALSKVVEGTPKVETFEVGNPNSHETAASAV